MINFDSDYLEGAHPEIIKKLTETNMEKNLGYGEDKYCKSAAEKIRKAIGVKDAEVHFLIGGTQANATVIKAYLRDYEGVISANTGHINGHEAGAVEATGHKVISIPGTEGKLKAQDVQNYLKTFYGDPSYPHMVRPGMVYISHPTELGTLYAKEELKALRHVCDEYKIPLFLDGARLGYGLMSPITDVTLKDIGELCDVFYIGGTKVGALFGEAVVFTRPDLYKNFFSSMKQQGAVLAKGRILGIQFDTLFTDDLYFKISKHAIDMAMKIKEGFKNKGYELYSDSPTNQQFILLSNVEAENFKNFVVARPVEFLDGKVVLRFTTSWATEKKDVDELIENIPSKK